jgi:hypothetical protein
MSDHDAPTGRHAYEQPPYTLAHVMPQPQKPRYNRRLLIVAGVAAGVVTLVALTVAGFLIFDVTRSATEDKNPFEQAQRRCDAAGEGTVIEDGGKTLLIDNTGQEDFAGVDLGGLTCLMEALQMPVAVKEHMISTRALDGRQQDSWGEFSASWSYHPDQGLDIIVTRK